MNISPLWTSLLLLSFPSSTLPWNWPPSSSSPSHCHRSQWGQPSSGSIGSSRLSRLHLWNLLEITLLTLKKLKYLYYNKSGKIITNPKLQQTVFEPDISSFIILHFPPISSPRHLMREALMTASVTWESGLVIIFELLLPFD